MNIISKKSSVLIVDDIPENIDVLAALLGNKYNVRAAVNSKKALDICLSQTPPDIILLDIMMPEMDGYEVCRILKSDNKTKNIPVIFVTTKREINEETKGFEVGAVDYITKPVSPPLVLARVDTHQQHQICNEKVKTKTLELKKTKLEIIKRLGLAAEFKDNETGFHVIRMSKICYEIAKAMKLSQEECELILNASPMHDIGKIGVPDNILLKHDKLTTEEWEQIKKHSQIGAAIIGDHDSELLQYAKTIALTHHEKWNGEGYPNGLSQDEIPLIGRIVALADVFDALINKRRYKDAWPLEKVYEYITSQSGIHFDPEVVEAFNSCKTQIMSVIYDYLEI